MSIEEILIFQQDDVYYGVDTSVINQILRVPDITPFVMSQREVLGLCNVSGNITSVLDTHYLMGTKGVDVTLHSARLLTLNGSLHASAMAVDFVYKTIDIEPKNLELEDDGSAIIGIYKYEGHIIQLVDFSRLIDSVKLVEYDKKEVKEGKKDASSQTAVKKRDDTNRYLLFTMEEELYALNIDMLREIIVMPESVSEIASSPKEVLGILSLRSELLVVIDMREYYGFKSTLSDKNRILVAQIGEKKIGLLVDAIIDIKEYPDSVIKEIPENFEDSKLGGIIEDDNMLISLISLDVIERIVTTNEHYSSEISESNNSVENVKVHKEVVSFLLNNQEYALDIDCVIEIIDAMDTTPVADAPELLKGVINIRGQVVPIGSLHYQLGLQEQKSDDEKVIICDIQKQKIGFCVDSVTDILEVSEADMAKENDESSLFSSVLHLDDGERLIMMIEAEKLLEQKRSDG